MNIIDNSGKGIAALGRDEDRMMAHVAPGEMVVPPVISESTKAIIRKEMQAAGLDPNEYQVGQGMSINPITGMAEFGFLKKLAKTVKKVVKKIAPIAAVIPGPWQPFAVVYQKGAAALKLAKGEGGLGDIMTLMAGGNQTLTGEGGAFKNIASGASNNFGAAEGYMGSLKNIGRVGGAFKPLQYGQNIMKSKASDLKQGFGGALGGNAGKFNVNTGQMDYFTDAAGNFTTRGFNPLKGISPMNNVPDQYVNAAGKTISIEEFQKLPVVDQAAYVPNASGGSFLDGKTPGQKLSSMFLPQSVEDALGTGPGGESVFSNKNSRGGIDPKMAALALLYGKAVKDAAEKNKGGLTDIRQSVRPDLMPQGTFQGFDLGIRKNAAYGGEVRQYFNQGGLAKLDNDGYITITRDRDRKPHPYGILEGNISETKLNLFERKQEIMDLLEDKKIRKKISTSKMKKLNEELRAINMELAGNFNQGMTRNARKNNESMRNALKSLRTGAAMGGLQELDMRGGGESEGPGTGTSDDIPAMLSDGEFVMTAAATKGAGGFSVNKTKSGIELIAGGKPNRKKGVSNLSNMMKVFEEYNQVGRTA